LRKEAVYLNSYATNNNTQFEAGGIRISKIGNLEEEGNIPPDNTQSAIQWTQEFLTANFGQPQPQTPPQK
jgi:hypothetical protein